MYVKFGGVDEYWGLFGTIVLFIVDVLWIRYSIIYFISNNLGDFLIVVYGRYCDFFFRDEGNDILWYLGLWGFKVYVFFIVGYGLFWE